MRAGPRARFIPRRARTTLHASAFVHSLECPPCVPAWRCRLDVARAASHVPERVDGASADAAAHTSVCIGARDRGESSTRTHRDSRRKKTIGRL